MRHLSLGEGGWEARPLEPPGTAGTGRGGSRFITAWGVTWAVTGQRNDARPRPRRGDSFHQETAALCPPHRDYFVPGIGFCGLEVKGPGFSSPRLGA